MLFISLCCQKGFNAKYRILTKQWNSCIFSLYNKRETTIVRILTFLYMFCKDPSACISHTYLMHVIHNFPHFSLTLPTGSLLDSWTLQGQTTDHYPWHPRPKEISYPLLLMSGLFYKQKSQSCPWLRGSMFSLEKVRGKKRSHVIFYI